MIVSVDKLAEVQHEIWSEWMRSFYGRVTVAESGHNEPVLVVIPFNLFMQWQRKMATPFSSLSEKEQESDYEQARKVWKVINRTENPKTPKTPDGYPIIEFTPSTWPAEHKDIGYYTMLVDCSNCGTTINGIIPRGMKPPVDINSSLRSDGCPYCGLSFWDNWRKP